MLQHWLLNLLHLIHGENAKICAGDEVFGATSVWRELWGVSVLVWIRILNDFLFFSSPCPQWFLSLHVSEPKGPCRGNALGPPNEWDNHFIPLESLVLLTHTLLFPALKMLLVVPHLHSTEQRSFFHWNPVISGEKQGTFLLGCIQWVLTELEQFSAISHRFLGRVRSFSEEITPSQLKNSHESMQIYLNICQGILAWRWDKHWDFFEILLRLYGFYSSVWATLDFYKQL